MIFRARFAGFSVLAIFGGCALGPNYHPPTPPPGATAPLPFAGAGADTAVNLPTPDNWWKLYNDPELNRLIAQAFAANADLRTAEANLAASRDILESERSAFTPQTDTRFGADYGRAASTDEILELTGHKPQTLWTFDALFDVSYELDLFGHVRRSVEAARDNAMAVAAARDDLRVTIAAETARAYGQICTLGEQISVSQRSLALAQRAQAIAQQRRDAGAGSDFEVLRQTVLATQVLATLPPLAGARQAALFELAALLGATPVNAPQDVMACDTAPHLNRPMPIGDGAGLLRRRPDIREADRKFAAALAQQGVATADLFPRITLGGLYGGVSDQINMLSSNNGFTWGIGPAISWTFPNMAAPLARLAQSKAGVAAAIASYDSAVLQALKETAQALTTYSTELDHHAALAAARNGSAQAYVQAQNQFSAGAISQLDLLASEQTLIGADAAVAASDAAIVQDQIAVFKALGGGWQP
jgi:NodT family efflux transporter outer membrane factor (OMF) lipoprotein